MDIRKSIYITTSALMVLIALAIVTCRVCTTYFPASAWAGAISPYFSVPFIFLFPAGLALTWFVEQSMTVHFKHRILVWIPMGLAGLLWAYLAVNLFFRSTII
ncbi:MAG: hypothetical protein HKP10_04580 [Kiritimatiellales bacterium]|nr:hypothetical protein [Kiritimatiellales bacterium]